MGQRSGVGGVGLGASCREWAGVSVAPLSARLQGGYHHAAHADPVEGPTALLPRRPGEELQRDSPAGHDLEPCGELMCPSAWGCTEAGAGRARTPGLCAGTREARSGQKRSWGLLALTLLLATLEDTSHPWGGADRSASGWEMSSEGKWNCVGLGEAAVLPCLSSALPMLMVIFFSLSPSFLLIVI